MNDDSSTPPIQGDASSEITQDLLEQANWGVTWTRINEEGDRIRQDTVVYGSFAQAAFLAAKMAAEGVRVFEISRWAGS